MNLVYCLLILLSLFIFTLESQTLKENREKRKLSVSLGYNFLMGAGRIGAKAISLDYSITGNLKLGVTALYVDKTSFFNSVFTPISCIPFAPCMNYMNIRPWTGKIYINYFPFSGAFYLSAAIGRLPDFTRKTIFYGDAIYSLDNSSVDRVYDQAITYTVSTANNYYINGSFGWRWDLDFGLLFGFDFGIAKEINKKRDVYVYSNSRGLIDRSRIPSLRDIVFYQAFTRPYNTDRNFVCINIYAGIAF